MTDQVIQDDVLKLRLWLKEQPDGDDWADDDLLEHFLSIPGIREEELHTRLKSYRSLRSTTPQWFKNRDPDENKILDRVSTGQCLSLLAKHPVDGGTVLLIRENGPNPKIQYSHDEDVKVQMMIMDAVLQVYPTTSKYGVHILVDLHGLSIRQALKTPPTVVRKVVLAYQDCYPLRVNGIHFINAPINVTAIITLAKMFMSDESKRKIHTHGKSLTSFYKFIPKEILPKEYGGDEGSIASLTEFWTTELRKRRKWFLECRDREYGLASGDHTKP